MLEPKKKGTGHGKVWEISVRFLCEFLNRVGHVGKEVIEPLNPRAIRALFNFTTYGVGISSY